jgi:hypothetical protein
VALKFGKTHRERVLEVLADDHETLDDAADAVFDLMGDLFAERAAFVVVGQLATSRERGSVPPSDPEAIKLALGPYSTEGDARSAAESLWQSAATGDTFRNWVLPVFAGTPAEFHKTQKDKLVAAEQKRKEANSERMQRQIEKRQQEAQERSDRIRAMEEAAGQHWPCPSNRTRAGGCLHNPTCK